MNSKVENTGVSPRIGRQEPPFVDHELCKFLPLLVATSRGS